MPDESITPLFFGRLIGVPSNIFGELVTVVFVARPADFIARKAALADALRVLPHYDPIFVDEARRGEPDVVMEARTALWHVDRVTHEVTISDILVGEDGVVEITADEHFYDALEMNLGNIPLRRVSVEAVISWTQSARGWIDFSNHIVRQWPGGRRYGNRRDARGRSAKLVRAGRHRRQSRSARRARLPAPLWTSQSSPASSAIHESPPAASPSLRSRSSSWLTSPGTTATSSPTAQPQRPPAQPSGRPASASCQAAPLPQTP